MKSVKHVYFENTAKVKELYKPSPVDSTECLSPGGGWGVGGTDILMMWWGDSTVDEFCSSIEWIYLPYKPVPKYTGQSVKHTQKQDDSLEHRNLSLWISDKFDF